MIPVKSHKKCVKNKKSFTSIKKECSELAIFDTEKVNTFGIPFSNICMSHINIIPKFRKLNEISNFLDSLLPMLHSVKHTSPYEIKHFILKLMDKKSFSYDLITNKLLMFLSNKSIILLRHLYNSILRLSYFPLIWKLSTIILFHKPNKPKMSPLYIVLLVYY